MKRVYPLCEFFRHLESWQKNYRTLDKVTIVGEEIDLSTVPPKRRQSLKILFMLKSEGVIDDKEASWKAMAFHGVQWFLINHFKEMEQNGFVLLNDGEEVIFRSEAIEAILEKFLIEPMPFPPSILFEDIAKRFKEIRGKNS